MAGPTAQSNQQVEGLELERVRTKVETVYEQDDMFYSSIEKKQVEKISNRLMRVPLRLAPGGAFKYFDPAGGDLGRGSGITYDKATLQAVFTAQALEYNKISEWGTDDSRKAVVNSVRDAVAKGMDEFRRQQDAQMQTPGTGVVGEISTATASGGQDTYVLTSTFGARLVRPGSQIQIYSSTLATLRGTTTILPTGWDVENNTIVCEPSVAAATTNDLIVVDGVSNPASVPALYGVPYHHSNASTGVWLGLSRANLPQIRASRVNGGSAFLTLPLPRLAINKIGNRVGIKNGFNPDAWMHPCQAQTYEEIGQLVSIIQKVAKEENLNMYFGGMQMAGATVKPDYNWNKTRIDFVSKEVWGRGEILPVGFYKTDGRNFFELRGSSGGVATADIFYLVVGYQTFVDNPAACSYIDNLSIASGY